MITDINLNLSLNQSLTTGTINSTNVIDLSQARDIGEGEDLTVAVSVNQAFAGGTSVTAIVVTADDAALTQNVTPIGSSGAIPLASLTAGNFFYLELNPQYASAGHQYIGIQYVCGGTFTQGSVNANVVKDIQDGKKFYRSGFTVI